MFSWFGGLGKQRSAFGKWIDEKGITQTELIRKSKLSDGTISKLCNDDTYRPKYATVMKVKKAVESLGYKLPKKFIE